MLFAIIVLVAILTLFSTVFIITISPLLVFIYWVIKVLLPRKKQ
jgi:hypothetical protein